MSYDLTPGEVEKVELKPNTEYFRYAFKIGGRYYGVHTGKALRKSNWNHAKEFEEFHGQVKEKWLGFCYLANFKGYGVFETIKETRRALGNASRYNLFDSVILKVEVKGKARLVFCALSSTNCLIVDSIKIINEVELKEKRR